MADSPDLKTQPDTKAPVASKAPEAAVIAKAPEPQASAPQTPALKAPAAAVPAKEVAAKPAVSAGPKVQPKPAPQPVTKPTVKPTAAQAKPTAAQAKAARRAARVAKAAQRPEPVQAITPTQTVNELKEKLMATSPSNTTTDFTQPLTAAMGDMQNRAKAAYEKGTEVATEVTEFAKGNVEALVESSKIFATGAQSLGKTYAEEAKSAYETLTADVKELAAVKTPAELFQLQGRILRRNFDMLVSTTSKNGEAVLKLAQDAAAPFTGRVNVAAEKFSKVA